MVIVELLSVRVAVESVDEAAGGAQHDGWFMRRAP